MIGYLKSNRSLLFRLVLALLSAWIVSLVLFAKPNEHFVPFFFLLFFPLLKFRWGEVFISLLTITSALLLPSYLLTRCAVFSSEMLWILLNTNVEETLAYITATPIKHELYVLCILAVFSLLLYAWHYNKSTPKSYWPLLVIALVVSPYVLSHSQLKTMYTDFQEVLSSKNLPPPSWHITKHVDDSVNTFVVVIGESLRKDALSLYGAPWNTNSRLNKLPLRLIDGYVAAGFNTTLAIPRVLSLPEKNFGKFMEQNNVINLAKEAGLNTYWITSQDMTGKHNASAGRIASMASTIRRVSHGRDIELLSPIREILKNDASRKILFVHMYGSHEPPCSRIKKEWSQSIKTGKGTYLDCYMSSVDKTDYVLSEILQSLNASGAKYKFVFFSDHALNMSFNEIKKSYLQSRTSTKKQVDIPYIEAGTDIKQSETIKKQRSAFHFSEYFPTWIGVETNMTRPNYDIFRDTEDSNPVISSYDAEVIPYSTLPNGLSLY